MDAQFQAAEDLCIQTARAHGIGKRTAQNCDNYSVGCRDCPFRSDDWKTVIEAIKEQQSK